MSRYRFGVWIAIVFVCTAPVHPGSAQTASTVAPADVSPAPNVPKTAALIGLAPTDAAPEVSAESLQARTAILSRLRFAYGEAAVVDGVAPDAAIQISTKFGRAFRGYDLAFAVLETKTKNQTIAHLRFADPAMPATAPTLVSLVDRVFASPAATTATPPTIELAPLASTAALHDLAVSGTALVAARLHDASGAVVTTRTANVPISAAETLGPRMIVTGAIARSGSAYDLRLSAFAADRTPVGELQLLVRDIASFPASSVFAPFVTSSLEGSPAPVVAGEADVTVLPFASDPELAEAAAIARAALVDRMTAGGIDARAAARANPSGSISIAGTFAKSGTGYRLDLVGHSMKSGGDVKTSTELAAPALVPSTTEIVALVDASKSAAPAPEHRFVYVPFANPSSKDGYINFANEQYGKDLAEHGYALKAEPDLDPVDARLSAPELCKRDGADGILLGTHIDHDQEYHKGALRTMGSFLGFLTFGIANAAVNALGNIASDDRYVNRANAAATLVDCNGKRMWNKTVQGGNSHYGRNAAAGGSGAISAAIEQLVASMFAETTSLATPAGARGGTVSSKSP